MMRGTDEQRAMVQESVDRFWWPALMMFGPPDDDSPNSAQSMAWGIKRNSNDELRQRFVDMTRAAGRRRSASRCPTPSCGGTRSAATTTSASPTGTSSRPWSAATARATPSGIAHRQAAHDDGAWVREAATAFASRGADA